MQIFYWTQLSETVAQLILQSRSTGRTSATKGRRRRDDLKCFIDKEACHLRSDEDRARACRMISTSFRAFSSSVRRHINCNPIGAPWKASLSSNQNDLVFEQPAGRAYIHNWFIDSSSLLKGAIGLGVGSRSLSTNPAGKVTAGKSRRLTMALYPSTRLGLGWTDGVSAYQNNLMYSQSMPHWRKRA